MFSDDFRKAPFLRILFPLIGGIILGRHNGTPPGTDWICIACSLAAFLISLWNGRHNMSPLLLIFLFTGIILGREPVTKDMEEVWIRARICSEVQSREKSKRATIDRIYYLKGKRWTFIDGRASVYFSRPSGTNPEPGMTLLARGKIYSFATPRNPDQFDYGRYQRGRGILYQTYLDSRCWFSDPEGRISLKIRSLRFRRKLISILEREIPEGGQTAVLKSLLLGYREDLDTIQQQNFARSGTMHILAVSGLHVGILYFLPALLLKRLKAFIFLWYASNILLFIVLWMYALVTGLSSSVVRAVCMCCIYGVGMMSRRQISSIHVLSLAAFIMIISRPPVVFEAGFQLSFAAVSGILVLYRRLLGLFPFRGWAGRRIAQMMAVSLAAQLSTMPLTIMYFNQFAPSALLANLLVIPLATLILDIGLLFFLCAGVGIPASLPAWILSKLSRFLEGFTGLAAGLPGAFFEGLTLSPVQVILFYITGILFLIYLQHRRPQLGFSLLLFLVLLLAVSSFREMRIRQHTGVYIFALSRETAIGFVKGKQAALFRPGWTGTEKAGSGIKDSGSHQTEFPLPYEIAPFFRNRGLNPELIRDPTAPPYLWHRVIHSPGMDADFFLFMEKRILILREFDHEYFSGMSFFKTDILVLCDNPKLCISHIIKCFQPSCIVADGSNYAWITRQFESECRGAGVNFHSTRRQGCFKIE